MVCIYCGGKTQVVNSRHQKRQNSVWRRRKCTGCKGIFSSVETVDLSKSISVARGKHIEAFSRDKLLFSIFSACGHRKQATEDATALTDTVVGKLLRNNKNPLLQSDTITEVTFSTLKRFDKAAAVQYQAYHPAKSK